MRGGVSWVAQASVGLWLCGVCACSSGLDGVEYGETVTGDDDHEATTSAGGESSEIDAGSSSDDGSSANDSGAGGASAGQGGAEQGGMHAGGQGGVNTGGQGGEGAGGEGGTGGMPESAMDGGVGGAVVDSGEDAGAVSECPGSPPQVAKVVTVAESAVKSGEVLFLSTSPIDVLNGYDSDDLRANREELLPPWIDVLVNLTKDLRLDLQALASENDTVKTFATTIRIARKDDGCSILRVNLTVEVH